MGQGSRNRDPSKLSTASGYPPEDSLNRLPQTRDASGVRERARQGVGGRLAQIDALRGLAAFWVVLSHYFPHWKTHLGGGPIIVPNEWGPYAVELFFVISGFVIFMSLEKCSGVRDFAVLRFSRLYPVYGASLVVVTILSVLVFGQEFWPAGFLVNSTMLQEFFGYSHYDVVYWSLSVELAFYANAALWLWLGIHRRVHWIIGVWLLTTIAYGMLRGPTADDERDWLARLLVVDYAPYFAIGMLFYNAARRGWSGAGIGLLALALLAELALDGYVAMGIAALITAVFAAAVSGHLHWLLNRVTLGLGAISYSLYLIHRNLGYLTLDWLHAHGVPVWVAVPLTIAAAVALATAFTVWIERPAIAWIRENYKRRFSCSA